MKCQQLVIVLLASTVSYAQNTSDLEKFWSYGRSPPVYPSSEGEGLGTWKDAYEEARSLVTSLTNEEKNNLTSGINRDLLATINGCSGFIPSLPRIDFPGLCFVNGPSGVRPSELVNAYPAAIHIGASWNESLALATAQAMGVEFAAKGVNVAEGPVAGPLGRVALGGRNWEGFAADPYLSGRMVYETIIGLQNSTSACVKHFIGNEQESNRSPLGSNASVSSNIDDRTMHEVYLWPFQDAVRAEVGCVMCSYQRVNNSYGCQNSKTMNGLLKGELGLQGFVVSDWFAQCTGIASAEAGLDVAMPSSFFWPGALTQAVTNGSMAQSRLDDMATRILAVWKKFSPTLIPGSGMPPQDLTKLHTATNALTASAKQVLFQGAVEGHVLVKNVNNALPLKKPKVLSLFGYDAIVARANNPAKSQKWFYGYTNVDVDDAGVLNLLGGAQKLITDGPTAAYNGTLIMGGGSGSSTPPYISAPYDAFAQQAYEDSTFLAWEFVSQDPEVLGSSDACIVFVNEWSSEAYDRSGLADSWSDQLIQNVAAKCNNTMVVIHNAGIRLVDAWIENPNVTAVIYGHLPGQDSGRALTEIMYGRQSPSGRLPYTVAKKAKDYGALLEPTLPDETSEYYTQSNFTEGLNIDYRHFIAHNITPRFEFGFGLTYTTFEYTDLQAGIVSGADLTSLPSNVTIEQGGPSALWNNVASVSFKVKNSGNVEAAEVAQLYVGIPGGPEKVLRAYSKRVIQSGQETTFDFDLTRRDLSTWDVVRQQWVIQQGNYVLHVGSSVLDIRLNGSLKI